MILDPNGMPILQPTIDNAETATFNTAFAAVGTAFSGFTGTRQIQTFVWADNAARTAQTGMTAGDEGYQTDTDTAYRYDGTAWVVVGVPDTGWQVPTLLNGWTNYGGGFQGARYRRKDGVVYVQGRINDGTEGVSVLNLPAGFRPTASLEVPVILYAGAAGRLEVRTNGDMIGVTVDTRGLSLSIPAFPL